MARFTSAVAAALLASASLASAQVSTAFGGSGAFVPQRGALIKTDAAGDEIYFADNVAHVVRKFTVNTNTLTTVAGAAFTSGVVDGAATAARFNAPQGLCTDGTSLFVADSGNHRIRKIVIATGVVSTFAGSTSGDTDAQSDPLKAKFNTPIDCAILTRTIDSVATSEFYITEQNRIRRINGTNYVSTVAGDASAGLTDGATPLFSGPTGICSDNGSNLYVADTGNNRIRKVAVTVAANTNVATVSASTWGAAPATIGPIISFADGNTLSAVFSAPTDCVYGNAADEIYVADRGNSRIRKIAGGAVTTIAGSAAGDADGSAAGTVRLWAPISVHAEGTATTTTKPSKLYVLDERARNIRQLTLATAGGVLSASKKLAGANAAATFPTFSNCVERLTFDVYCTDSTQHVVRRIKDGVVTTVAGTVGVAGSGDSDTAGTSATFNGPTYIAVAGVNLYISDSGNGKIRRMDVTTNSNAGKVETLADTSATPATCTSTQGVAVKADGSALWFACNANKVYRISTPTGAVTGITWTGVLGTHATASELVAIPANPISNTAGTDATKANTATSSISGLCLGRLAALEDSLFVLESNRVLGVSLAANGWGGASAGLYGPFTGTVAAGSTTTSATTGALLSGPRACVFGDSANNPSATNLLYVLEGTGNRVRGFDLSKNTVSDRIPAVQIGGGTATGTTAGDGTGLMTAATTGAVVSLRAPTDLFLQAEALGSTVTLGVVDGGNGRIKSVSLPTANFLGTASYGLYRKPVVPTLCCALSTSVSVCLSGDNKFYKYTRSGTSATLSFFAGQGGTTGVDGDAVTGTVKTAATAVACDMTNSNVYFFDSLGTDKVRKIASTGAISTITTSAAISGAVTDVHGLAVIPTGSAAGLYVSTKLTAANDAIHIRKSALDGTGVVNFWKESGTTAPLAVDTTAGVASIAGTANSPAKKVTRLCVGKQAADGDTLFAVANDNDVAAGATTIYAFGTAAQSGTSTVVDKDKVTIFYGGATATADDTIDNTAGKAGKITGGGACAQIGTDLYVREVKRIVKIPVGAAADRKKTAQWGKYAPTVAADASCSTATALAATTDVFNAATDLFSDGTTLSVLDGSKRIHQISTTGSCTADTVTVQGFDAVVDAAAPAAPTALSAVGGFANGALGFGSLFNSPSGIAQAGNDFYVTDTNNHVIRKVAIANGTATVSVWAGEVNTAGDVIEGDGSLQRFNAPTFIVSNFSNAKWWLYVSDAGNNKVKKIEAAAQPVTTILAGAAAGTTASGNVPSAAGTNTPAAEALFNAPAGLAIAGDWVFVADSGNNAIKKISAAGVVTYAFSGTVSSPAVATDAFLNPQGLLANGTSWLLVADKGRHRIRRCDIANATAAVTACTNYIGTGVAGVTDSTLSSPHALATDQKGNFFVVETGSNKIRRFANAGVTLSVAIGASAAGAAGLVEQAAADASGAGTYTTARISGATGVVFDSANPTVAYIADAGNHRIRKVDVLGERATTATVTATTTNTTTMTNTTTTTRTATATATTTTTNTNTTSYVTQTFKGKGWQAMLANAEQSAAFDANFIADLTAVINGNGTKRRQSSAVKVAVTSKTATADAMTVVASVTGSAAQVNAAVASVTAAPASSWTKVEAGYKAAGNTDFVAGTASSSSGAPTTTTTTTKAPSAGAAATAVAVLVAALALLA